MYGDAAHGGAGDRMAAMLQGDGENADDGAYFAVLFCQIVAPFSLAVRTVKFG